MRLSVWTLLLFFVFVSSRAFAQETTVQTVVEGRVPVHLRDVKGKYVCAEIGGGKEVMANRDKPAEWETFVVFPVTLQGQGDVRIAMRASNGRYVSADETRGMALVADRDAIGPWEQFTLKKLDDHKFSLRAWNGSWVTVHPDRGGALVADGSTITDEQIFRVERLKTDVFSPSDAGKPTTIVNVSLQCLDVAQASTKPGAELILWPCGSDPESVGSVRPQKNQYFEFHDVNYSSDSGTYMTMKKVRITPRHALGTLCLTGHGFDKPVTFEPCKQDGSDRNQLWRPFALDSGRANTISGVDGFVTVWVTKLNELLKSLTFTNGKAYQFRSYDGYCLDVLGGANVQGKQLGLWHCKTYADNQVFMMEP